MKLELPNDYDEDEVWLFERIVNRLESDHGHTHEKAIELVNSYHRKFTNEDYCHRHQIPVQNIDFFCHIESAGMADRVHYYEVLLNVPNESEFIQWQRNFRS